MVRLSETGRDPTPFAPHRVARAATFTHLALQADGRDATVGETKLELEFRISLPSTSMRRPERIAVVSNFAALDLLIAARRELRRTAGGS